MNEIQTFPIGKMMFPMPVLPANPQFAQAYVPYQYFKCIYRAMEGLENGTIFPELDIPYIKVEKVGCEEYE